MSQSVINCNNTNNNNHHPQQQRESQKHGNSSHAVYSGIVPSTCSGGTDYPITLANNLSHGLISGCNSITNNTDATSVAFGRSHQTRVIVAPNMSSLSPSSSSPSSSSSASTHVPQQHHHHYHHHSTTEESSSNTDLYGITTPSSSSYITAQAGNYLSGHHPSVGSSSVLHSSCSSSSFVYPSNFFQPYYGLSPTLNEFNVLQMCCQPLLTEVCPFFFFNFFPTL